MNRFVYLLCTLSICLMASMSCQAQAGGAIHLNYTSPLDEYDDNLVKDPVGFTLKVFYALPKAKAWVVGVEAGVAMYANDSYMTALENGKTIEIDEEDCFVTYNATIRRYLLTDKRINPYGEMIVGGVSFFSTRYAAESKYEDDYDDNTTFHGTAFNLGFGGGLSVNLSDNVMLDFGAIYNRGTRTHYRSIEPGEGAQVMPLDYGRKESYVNSITFKAGVQFGF
ncbi:MAG: outer membrane beta-barrel protein [Bacteroidota bacterium]